MDKRVDMEPSRMQPHRRLAAALVAAQRRLMRGRAGPAEPIWTPEMSRSLAVGLCLALIASLADASAIHYVRRSQDAVIDFMAYITNIGQSQWFLVPAALIFLAVGLLDWSRKGIRGKARLSFLFGQAAYVFSAVALSGIFVNIFKVMFGRARPRLIDEVGPHHFDPFTFGYLHASFPSGHSTTVGAIVGIVMIWYPRWSLVTIELGLFFAATRVAAGAHYPSDVATGFLVGIFFSIVIARWLASRGVAFRFAPGKVLPVPAAITARKSRN